MYGYFLRMNETTLFNMKRTLVLPEIPVRAIAKGHYLRMHAATHLPMERADHSAGADDRSPFLSKRRISEGNALAPSNIFR